MKKFILVLLVFSSIIIAQVENLNLNSKQSSNNQKFSGVLFQDSYTSLKSINDKPANDEIIVPSKKSPILSAGMSLIIPGTGQFYSERYIKSAAFVAIEAAAIIVGLMYDKKGNDQTSFFQNYANAHWSVDRYAKWVVTNGKKVNDAINTSDYNIFVNGKVNWSELNRLESDLGSYFSHRLPYYGEQQYYELIGKYPQYNVGWDDFGDENTPFEYDPTRKNLTANFVYYSQERGKANDYYNIAAKAVVVIVVNHIVSALDAAWSAHNYNKDLDINMTLEKYMQGLTSYYYPQLNLQYRF